MEGRGGGEAQGVADQKKKKIDLDVLSSLKAEIRSSERERSDQDVHVLREP
jgi:hypothetical protein